MCVTLLNIRGSMPKHAKLLHVLRCSECCTWGGVFFFFCTVPVLHHCNNHLWIVSRPHWSTNSCLNAPCTCTVPLGLINCSTRNRLYSTELCAIVKYISCYLRLTRLLVLFTLPTTQCCQLKIKSLWTPHSVHYKASQSNRSVLYTKFSTQQFCTR